MFGGREHLGFPREAELAGDRSDEKPLVLDVADVELDEAVLDIWESWLDHEVARLVERVARLVDEVAGVADEVARLGNRDDTLVVNETSLGSNVAVLVILGAVVDPNKAGRHHQSPRRDIQAAAQVVLDHETDPNGESRDPKHQASDVIDKVRYPNDEPRDSNQTGSRLIVETSDLIDTSRDSINMARNLIDESRDLNNPSSGPMAASSDPMTKPKNQKSARK